MHLLLYTYMNAHMYVFGIYTIIICMWILERLFSLLLPPFGFWVLKWGPRLGGKCFCTLSYLLVWMLFYMCEETVLKTIYTLLFLNLYIFWEYSKIKRANLEIFFPLHHALQNLKNENVLKEVKPCFKFHRYWHIENPGLRTN